MTVQKLTQQQLDSLAVVYEVETVDIDGMLIDASYPVQGIDVGMVVAKNALEYDDPYNSSYDLVFVERITYPTGTDACTPVRLPIAVYREDTRYVYPEFRHLVQ